MAAIRLLYIQSLLNIKMNEGNWIKIDNELEKTVEGNSTLLKSKASPVTLELPAGALFKF